MPSRVAMQTRSSYRILILVLAILAMPTGHAAPVGQMMREGFGRDLGLENPNVAALAEDPSGLMWVGTERGLFVFDGRHFHRASGDDGSLQQNGFVNNMALAPDGRLWVGTRSGLYRHLRGERFEAITNDRSPTHVDSNASMAFSANGHTLYLLQRQQLWALRNIDSDRPLAQPLSQSLPRTQDDLTSRFVDQADALWPGAASLCASKAGDIGIAATAETASPRMNGSTGCRPPTVACGSAVVTLSCAGHAGANTSPMGARRSLRAPRQPAIC